MTNIQIPLNSEGEKVYKDMETYHRLINSHPKKDWIAKNQNVKYLPIRCVEELLRQIFPAWQVEQNGQPQLIGNSIVVSVHLKVYHPILQDWLTYAGVGAFPIQLKRGSKPLDFDNIITTALHKNVPAALSFAVNNAAKKIGKIFGSHLNSTETIYND